MSRKEKYDFKNHIKNIKKIVKEFVFEKDQYTSKLKNYILRLQNINSELYNLIFDARAFYFEKRQNYNIKLAKLKSQKSEYEQSLKHLIKKIDTLQRPNLNSNNSVPIDFIIKTIEDIEYKINIIKKKIKEQILNIEEENELIERLREFEDKKNEKVKALAKLEEKQAKIIMSSDYYKNQKRIETLEMNLKEIYENMTKLLKKRLITHRKMFDLYRNINEFENIKTKIANELIENKIIAADCQKLFLKLINKGKEILLDRLFNKPKKMIKPNKINTRIVKGTIKEKGIKKLGNKLIK